MGSALRIMLADKPSKGSNVDVTVHYSTGSGAAALQFLEKEYEEASRVANGLVEKGVRKKVEVLPTLDGRGRLYDVGKEVGQEEDNAGPGNRKKKEKV